MRLSAVNPTPSPSKAKPCLEPIIERKSTKQAQQMKANQNQIKRLLKEDEDQIKFHETSFGESSSSSDGLRLKPFVAAQGAGNNQGVKPDVKTSQSTP